MTCLMQTVQPLLMRISLFNMNIFLYTPEKLAELQHKLAKYRERLAQVRVEYETLKDKKQFFRDEVYLEIKEQNPDATVKEIEGLVSKSQKWLAFYKGYEEAKDRYIKGKVYVDNLETEWETTRTIIANLRKERFNV